MELWKINLESLEITTRPPEPSSGTMIAKGVYIRPLANGNVGGFTKSNLFSFLDMSLACLVCHGVESPSHSFRSYSVSSSDEGRCAAITNCLIRKASLPHLTANNIASSSKVTPQPTMPLSGVTGAPRLVRSHAVSRDLVRDWNFDEVVMER
ncbi:hypothetical protein RJ639_036438 [Escallonia herrerae]|uniref:Uncharacterized protein n=1 Tax=Escallonia herrerae TaxID=1293975 RepID=A0AA88WR92_9ASTE|nr:hypothetical protein RJ639_036438 [Escallonia herrerae]